MKQLLEGAAARLMAARGNIPELEAMRSNVADADAAVLAGDTARYAELVRALADTGVSVAVDTSGAPLVALAETQIYDAGTTADGRKAYAFEATSGGDVVVKNGWAEVEG